MAEVSPLHAAKRSRDELEQTPSPRRSPSSCTLAPSGKKRRTLAVKASKLAEFVTANRAPGPDPYRILPMPTTEWIQLRFALDRFKGVYRVVQVPSNYNFANLHTLVQYLFGWNGFHSHRARVYTNVEMYKSAGRLGSIKTYGQAPTPPDDWYMKDCSAEVLAMQEYMWQSKYGDAAIYEVVALGQNSGPRKNDRGEWEDWSWHHKVEDNELTLADVWNVDEDKNVSKGEFSNENVGIIYEYELGCPWAVHITIDDGFYTNPTPGNDIYVVAIKGAPSVEEKHHWDSDHPDGSKKAVSDLFLDPGNWKLYCKKEISTRTLRDRLVVNVLKVGSMTDDDVEDRQNELQAIADTIRKKRDEKEKERKRELRLQRKLEREAELAAEREREKRRQLKIQRKLEREAELAARRLQEFKRLAACEDESD